MSDRTNWGLIRVPDEVKARWNIPGEGQDTPRVKPRPRSAPATPLKWKCGNITDQVIAAGLELWEQLEAEGLMRQVTPPKEDQEPDRIVSGHGFDRSGKG
jgi:hypothetical protein